MEVKHILTKASIRARGCKRGVRKAECSTNHTFQNGQKPSKKGVGKKTPKKQKTERQGVRLERLAGCREEREQGSERGWPVTGVTDCC